MLDSKENLLIFPEDEKKVPVLNSTIQVIQVKKIHYPKITDDDVSKISTNIKSFVIKMKNDIKEKGKIINEYAKIINGTKKEYQKLYAENIKYRDKSKQQQEHDQQEYERQIREKEIYEKQRECDKQYIRRSKKPELKKQRYFSESEIESESEAYCNFGYDESDRKTLPPKKKIERQT